MNYQTKLVRAVVPGDRIRANDAGDIKTIRYIAKAQAPGYLVAIFDDGTQRALGHKKSETMVVV